MISEKQALEVMSYFDIDFLDPEWLAQHCKLKFGDSTHTISIEVDNVNESDYEMIKKAT